MTSAKRFNIKIRETKSGNKFYVLDDVMYDIHFPLCWAIDHMPGTGPVECQNCDCYGKINHVFVAYCANCVMKYSDVDAERSSYIPPNVTDEMLWNLFGYLNEVPNAKSKIGFCESYYDERYIPSYRGDVLMSPREVFARIEELKVSCEDYEKEGGLDNRRDRMDYADILEQIIYLHDIVY